MDYRGMSVFVAIAKHIYRFIDKLNVSFQDM